MKGSRKIAALWLAAVAVLVVGCADPYGPTEFQGPDGWPTDPTAGEQVPGVDDELTQNAEARGKRKEGRDKVLRDLFPH